MPTPQQAAPTQQNPTPPPDIAEQILRSAPVDDNARADAWDAFHQSQSEEDLTGRLQKLNLPQSVKADLWDAKHSGKSPNNTVTIGGSPVDLKTGAGGTQAATAQAQQRSQTFPKQGVVDTLYKNVTNPDPKAMQAYANMGEEKEQVQGAPPAAQTMLEMGMGGSAGAAVDASLAAWTTRLAGRLGVKLLSAGATGVGAATGNVVSQIAGLPDKTEGMTRFKASDGTIHSVPDEHIDKAKAIDPGLINLDDALKTGELYAGGELAGSLVGGAASKVADAGRFVKNFVAPSKEVAEQGFKNAVAKVGNIKDPDILNTIHDYVDKPKIASSVENELLLAKPKIEADLKQADSQLDNLRQNSTGTVSKVKQTIHTYLDDMVAQAQEFGVDKDAVVQGIHNVRDEITSKLHDDSTTFKGLSDLKRLVDEQITSWKKAPPVTDTVKKAEQETLKGVRARIQDLENQAEPAAKAVNSKISNLMQASEALDKKFPNLTTAEEVANTSKSLVRERQKELALKTAKVVGGGLTLAGLGHLGIEAIKGVTP
jgi:hypothetical protein